MILDGNKVKQHWIEVLKKEVDAMNNKPVLTIITVGDDPASKSYVKNKVTTAAEIGIEINHVSLPKSTTQTDLMLSINQVVFNKRTNGLIVQLPIVSDHPINERAILNYIPAKMDVDCLGDSMYSSFICGDPYAVPPCTSQGVIDLLDYYGVPLAGRDVVVVGRSRLVGKGLFELLLRKDATVTMAHSKSDLACALHNQDIIISAVGVKDLVNKYNFDRDANKCFVNVGLSRVDGELCGDIDISDFDLLNTEGEVLHTPYSAGGVGPLTVINLMKNTITLTKQQGQS